MAVQSAPQPDNRWQEIIDIWRSNQWLFIVIGYLLGLLTFPLLQEIITNLAGLLSGFVPEAVGIGFTVIFIDRLNQQREEKRKIEELKARLVREAGSPVNDVAVQAVNELRNHGWLVGDAGLLKEGRLNDSNFANASLSKVNLEGANLMRANLEDASLISANLANANLDNANLTNANLISANLASASLISANLTGAILWYANLTNANLRYANLTGAELDGANLAGTNLDGANFHSAGLLNVNLTDANLEDAEFDEKMMLPDTNFTGIDNEGNFILFKYWTPDTDMTRYTDPNHPDFWQPDWVKDNDDKK